jgi:restriction endonuclease S subunit
VFAGDVGSFRGGSGFPVKHQGTKGGTYPFFKVSDMNNGGNELFMRTARHYIAESQRKQMGAVVMPKDAIVFAKVGAAIFLERKRILSQPSCIDNNMAAFVLDPAKADVRFVHYLLTNFAMASLAATTALPSLNGGQLRSIPLSLPTELDEQRGIAHVLGDADSELDALEVRLTKAKAIKQGMMQELLTGRTRLPVLEGAA